MGGRDPLGSNRLGSPLYREMMLWLGWAVVCVAISAMWWLSHQGGYRQVTRTTYDAVMLTVSSPHTTYQPGEAIPISLVAENSGDRAFIQDTTTDLASLDLFTPVGLGPVRPAYDLVFVGYFVDGTDVRHDLTWVWSEHQSGLPVSPRVELQSGEQRELIRTTWYPPAEARYVQGRFYGRFATVEFTTGVHIREPER